MSMAKKKKQKHPHIDKSPVRKRKAKKWVQAYTGTDIVKDYREYFRGVDVACAVRELQEIGYEFEPGYENNVLNAEAARIRDIHRKKEIRQQPETYHDEFQDDNFYFIAGYTSGGAPYGIQWWEMGLEPWENELDDDNEEYFGGEIDEATYIIGNHRSNFENRAGAVKKAGKNHVRVNSTLLQTNKKWSHLKQKQRDWIYEIIRSEHKKFIEENNRLPMKSGKKMLIAVVESKVDERGIWLPSYELEKGVGKYIDRLNRRTSLDKD